MGYWESNLTYVCAAACGAAVVAFAIAWRGRRVDDHPLCRKCGFDLFGLPETSHRCPECGRDLRLRRARQIGHRRRFRALGWGAALLFLAGGGWLGFAGVVTVRGTNVYPYKPVSWLLAECKGPSTRDAALDEVERRMKRGEMSADQLAPFVEVGLAHQADVSQAWVPRWGEFIDRVSYRKLLARPLWDRYAAQAGACFTLDVRADHRRGHLIPFRVNKGAQRVGSVRFDDLRRVAPKIHLDGQVLHVVLVKSDFSADRNAYEGFVELPDASVMRLDDGEHQFGATVNWKYEGPRDGAARSPEDAVVQVRLSRTIRVSSRGASKVALHFADDLVAGVEGALSATVTADPAAAVLRVTVNSAGAPIDLAFVGRLEAGGLQRDLGELTFDAGQRASVTVSLIDVLPAWSPETVDLTLRPSVDAAENTLAMSRVWGGQVSLYGVKVTPFAPPRRK